MTDFRITFIMPWFLLLFIPAAFVTFFPYFRSSKKYRRNRNRITSLVLHACISVLLVLLAANTVFSYNVPNDKNELIILVDKSFSGRDTTGERDSFVKSLIEESGDGVNLGIVTFGYDQVCVLPLTSDKKNAYEKYVNANSPDDSASDIASALEYAKGMLNHPQTAKIVLISDGMETDGKAKAAVRSVAAQGVKVDVKYVAAAESINDLQISEAKLPEETPALNTPFDITVTLDGTYEGSGSIIARDNGEEIAREETTFEKGERSFTFSHTFTQNGLHRLTFIAETEVGDEIERNDVYNAYMYVEVYDDILIIENYAGESSRFRQSINESAYNYTTVTVNGGNLPKTAAELCAYDEVILFNIANEDLPTGFVTELNKYVKDYGGGLFTTGGKKNGSFEANAYNRSDLKNSDLQKMLPVEAVEYTPPEGIMFVVDVSGSMEGRVGVAVDALRAAINGLDRRNWIGIMTLNQSFGKILDLTPMSNLSDIEAALESLKEIEGDGATKYKPALQTAGTALAALNTVQVKHIVLISDAKEESMDENDDPIWESYDAATGEYSGGYGQAIRDNREKGIICSIVDMSNNGGLHGKEVWKNLAEDVGGGKYLPIDASDPTDAGAKMVDAVFAAKVEQEIEGEFIPKVTSHTGVLTGVDEKTMPSLDGFFGTKLKDGATAVLSAEYNIPVYAQWQYGKGKVGSFTSDLDGTWSSSFLSSETGAKLLKNMLVSLFPSKSIQSPDISASIESDNYHAELNLFVDRKDGDEISVVIESLADGTEQRLTPTAEEGYSKVDFVTPTAGIYSVTVTKVSSDDKEDSCRLFYAFSYSSEFDVRRNAADGENLIKDIAELSGGTVLEGNEARKAFVGFERKESKVFDPRIIFAVAALILFLLDVAVRKFKFKWLHEIIRDAVAKKARNGGNKA